MTEIASPQLLDLKDYTTILVVADLIPESVLNEDDQLQMFYDTAVTRSRAAE